MESSLHINVLELRFALKSFESLVSGKHVLIQMDNRTAVTYLNKVGGTHAKDLSDLALQIWQWSLERNIVITAEYLLGKECDSRSGITPLQRCQRLETQHTSTEIGTIQCRSICSVTQQTDPNIFQLEGRFSSSSSERIN